MSKTIACVIARTVSTRLPLKVLREILPNVSMIEFLINRLKTVKSIDDIYICTSNEECDDIMDDVAGRNNVKIYRGSADQVTQRMIAVGELENANILLRITGDNPLTTVEFLDDQISFLVNKNLDYVRIVDVPIGSTAEVMTFSALKRCHAMMDPNVSEYLMLFLFEPKNFKCGIVKVSKDDNSQFSITVDTKEDLIRTKKLLEAINKVNYSQVLLSDIIQAYNREDLDLPGKSLSFNGNVKMPYGKVIPFSEFYDDMKRRKNESEILNLYE